MMNHGKPPTMAKRASIFRHRDLALVGLSRGRLRGMVQRKEAQRVSRGLYRRAGAVTELDSVATVCARLPGAIVCLLSALLIHDLGSQLPSEVWIALDRRARKPRIDDLPMRIVRFSGPMLRYGVEIRRVQGVAVSITSPARTIVDCFRYRNKIGVDIALEALKDGLQRRLVTVNELTRAAKACRVFTVIKPYLEAAIG